MSPDKERNGNIARNTGITYKVQGNCIFTSMPKCTLEVAYRAFNLDDEGMPLIPDNGSYARALEEYITVECYTNLFDEGRIAGKVLSNRQQRYAYYVGQAQTELVKLSLDQATSFSNMWNKLLPSKRDYNNGFVSEGAAQVLRRY